MKTFEYVIKDEVGIHARPAGLLGKKCKEFASTVTIAKGDKEAVATKLMALMGLGVKCHHLADLHIALVFLPQRIAV